MSSPGEPAGHHEYEDMAVAHVLGGLDEDRGRVFRAHLLECGDCRARVGELRAIASDLAGVERNARREQAHEPSERTLDTKERDEGSAAAVPAQPPRWPWVALGVLVVAVMALSVYAFVLRGQVDQLEQAVAERTTASAVLEHGAEVPLSYEQVGVSGAVRADGREVVVVVDELDNDGEHLVTLIDEAGATRPLPATVADGRLFVLVEREPTDEYLRVQAPDGELVVEAELDG